MDPGLEWFVRLADDRQCKSIEAASAIRRHAIKKNGVAFNQDDHNLLPTLRTLRRTEPLGTDRASQPDNAAGAFSPGRIVRLLRCKCDGICDRQTATVSDRDDNRLAQDIASHDEQLKLFTVLCLSGCLFAARLLIRNGFTDAASLPQIIQHPDRHELRVRLFSSFQQHLRDCPHPLQHGENRMMCLAKIFSDCISHRAWLTRIPTFGRSEDLVTYELRQNMPFMEQSEPQQTRQHRRYFKFKVAPNHCTEDSENLESVFLFRKQIQFDDHQLAMRDEAREESSILSFINDMRHESIVELLCAYQETRYNFDYINLVFPWYEYDLDAILKGRAPSDVLNDLIPEPSSAPLLESRFWKSVLGILDGVRVIHSPQHENVRLPSGEVIIGGHFDIKPANILVNGFGKLVLADFGQAQLKPHRVGQASGLTARPGTLDYSPPPSSTSSNSRLNRSYDVWSIGCVVLEILTFLLLGGPTAVRQFCADRYNEEREGDRSAAFWIKINGGRPVLKRSVRDRLTRLEDLVQRNKSAPGNHNITSVLPVIKELQAMLSVDERFRPTIEEALRTFRAEGALDFSIFISQREREVMKRKLKEMHTSFTTERYSTPLPCDLSLWRDVDRGGDNESMKLVISATLAGSYAENTMVRGETLMPMAGFDLTASFTAAYQSRKMLQCSFANMHRPTTLHFYRAKDYFEFQAMTTYQSLHIPKDVKLAEVIELRFTSATLHLHGTMLSKIIELSSGRVQIWRTLKELQYQHRFEPDVDSSPRAGSSASSTLVNSSPASQEAVNRVPTSSTLVASSHHKHSGSDPHDAKFKMAIFTFDPNKRTCIVMDLIKDNYTLVDRTSTRLSFSRARSYRSFPVAMFGWRAGEKATALNAIPGVPLSPAVLENEILNGVKMESLELDMEGAGARNTLKALYDSIWVRP